MGNAIRLAVSVFIPLMVGGLSGVATAKGVQDWYPTLEKPSFNPPAWVFGPVWTLLYIMMGIAAYLVWLKGLDRDLVRVGLIMFAIQLALNGLWSVFFFGMRLPCLAFFEIVVLWVFIAVTASLFWRSVPVAGVLLLPYLAWVSFAVVLNGSIWVLNR